MRTALRLYAAPLKYFGLLPLAYDAHLSRYALHADCAYYLLHVAIQLFALAALTIASFNRADYMMGCITPTGNNYEYMVLWMGAAMLLLTNAWLLVVRRQHFALIEQCQRLSDRFLTHDTPRLGRHQVALFAIVSVVCLIYTLNIVCIVCAIGWQREANMHLMPLNQLPYFAYVLRTIVAAYLLGFYVAIVDTVRELMRWLSASLAVVIVASRPIGQRERLQQCLWLYDRLMLLCSEDLSTVYGVVLLSSCLFGTMELVSNAYIITINLQALFNTELETYVYMLLWSLPVLLSLTTSCICSDLGKEARKITNILSKAPRTDLAINKMIDKFLLKNLRPAPILTAYGFFSLDKDTLFKLFTAIFTYMVILVQFKEMEVDMPGSRKRNASYVS